MSKTPYSDSHAEKVRIVAETYDPDALVVPHRKAMALELERDEARAALWEAYDTIDSMTPMPARCGTWTTCDCDECKEKRKAAGLGEGEGA